MAKGLSATRLVPGFGTRARGSANGLMCTEGFQGEMSVRAVSTSQSMSLVNLGQFTKQLR